MEDVEIENLKRMWEAFRQIHYKDGDYAITADHSNTGHRLAIISIPRGSDPRSADVIANESIIVASDMLQREALFIHRLLCNWQDIIQTITDLQGVIRDMKEESKQYEYGVIDGINKCVEFCDDTWYVGAPPNNMISHLGEEIGKICAKVVDEEVIDKVEGVKEARREHAEEKVTCPSCYGEVTDPAACLFCGAAGTVSRKAWYQWTITHAKFGG